jgi:hypothetical protein
MRASMTIRSALISALGAIALAGSMLMAPGDGAGGTAAAAEAAAAAAGSTVNVTVNAAEGLGAIPSTAYGLNTAVWDSQMNTTQTQGLLRAAGVDMLRYPGGSYGDAYNWQNNTVQGGYVAPGTDFDQFMGTAQAIGAQPILIANYGTGTPQEAAAWVQYANVTKGYGVKYWEIGNEQYGDGIYGANWEANNYSDKSPAHYATELLQFASAMKAVDPSIKIGAVLTLPGNWPDSVVASGASGDWNQQVLSIAGSAIDFAIVHFYPPSSLGASVVNAPDQLGGELAQLRQEINQYAGAHGPGIQVAMTETDGNNFMDTQPGALYGADTYMTSLENGVFTVDYWDLRNGATAISTAPDGATDYGDEGVLSSGGCVGSTCEPPMSTPFPSYYAISMLSKLGLPGDTMVNAGTDQQLVTAHAVRNANGDLSVMLINKDPVNSYQVNLDYAGFTPAAGAPTVYSYGDEASGITTAAQGSAASQVLPPYSIMGPDQRRRRGQVRGLPAERHRQRTARHVHLGLVHGEQPGARDRVHAQRAGPGPGRVPVAAVHPSHVHHQHPQQLNVPGELCRHPGLGQRVRGQHQHHQHRAGPDRRLDARVLLPGQLGVGQLRLERDLVRDRPGGHRDQPELGRDARGGRREHGRHRLRRGQRRGLSVARRVHPQRHRVRNHVFVLTVPDG